MYVLCVKWGLIIGMCSAVKQWWDIFYKLLTKIENGEECCMTPKEVTSGEYPEYVFASISCFNMAKLWEDIMAPKNPNAILTEQLYCVVLLKTW